MVALSDTHSDKAACKGIDIVTEFDICSCVIKLGVPESVLLREFLAHTVKDIRERFVNEMLLGPYILACVCLIVLKLVLSLLAVLLHVVSELRENDARILKVACPSLNPLERDVPAVAKFLECFEDCSQRHVSFTHDLILRLTVYHD